MKICSHRQGNPCTLEFFSFLVTMPIFVLFRSSSCCFVLTTSCFLDISVCIMLMFLWGHQVYHFWWHWTQAVVCSGYRAIVRKTLLSVAIPTHTYHLERCVSYLGFFIISTSPCILLVLLK